MRRVLVILAGILLASPAAHAAREGGSKREARLTAVQRLIADLGSDEYAVRRRAEEQLLRLGPAAFDELKLAENNSDLEIAERVKYIVQRMRVQWIHPNDSSEVRLALARYGDLSDPEKHQRIRRIAELEGGAGLPALCRIARFEPSPLVARRAALALIKQKGDADQLLARAAACRQELGASARAPVRWIQLRFRELEEPREAVAAWAEATDAEAALLSAKSPETEFAIVRELMQRSLDRCHELKLSRETTDALAAMVALIRDQLARNKDQQLADDRIDPEIDGLAWGMNWIIRHARWDVLAEFEDRYAEQLAASRKLTYHLAAAHSKAGRLQRASELAERAFRLQADDDDQRVRLAEAVADLGFVDWAEREYRRTIETAFPVIHPRSLEARSSLAMWLHDREDYRGAADLLGELCDALDADAAARRRLIVELNEEGSPGRETINGVVARREFYLACLYESQGDYQRQSERLQKAIAAYSRDPDILIAMYRLKGASDDLRQKTLLRIRSTAAYQQQLIDEYPDLPALYNQWAWLVGNTEGDQAKAVAYSRRSLELSPDEPSYLDTLGRCYFAVGDLENAVKYQRQAVKQAPHYQVMKRQLKQFEDALAAKSK